MVFYVKIDSIVLKKIFKEWSPFFLNFEGFFFAFNTILTLICAIYMYFLIRMILAKSWGWPSGFTQEILNVKSLLADGKTDGQTDGRTRTECDKRKCDQS